MPRGQILRGYAGSLPGRGLAARPARRVPVPAFGRLVTVDLSADGVAPTAVFNGSGVAQAQVGPHGTGETWQLDQCFLSTSVGQLDAATCVVYVGPQALPMYAVTGSLQGGASQFGLGGTGLQPGEFVIAVWSGGTAAALAYLRVTGVKTALAQW